MDNLIPYSAWVHSFIGDIPIRTNDALNAAAKEPEVPASNRKS